MPLTLSEKLLISFTSSTGTDRQKMNHLITLLIAHYAPYHLYYSLRLRQVQQEDAHAHAQEHPG